MDDTSSVVDTVGGLTSVEVDERVVRGQVNGRPVPAGRPIRQIVRANLLTRFNVLLGGLFAATLAVRATKDTLFIWVVVVNLVVGVVQEMRARRTLEQLSVVDAARVRVRRDGVSRPIDPAELVSDDVILLGRGEQVPVDAVVVHQCALEVDESLLTGEADPRTRRVGDALLSGSVIVAGSALVEATAVGDAAYARRLTNQARQFALTGSELRAGTDSILRVVTWALIPTAVLLLWSQLISNESISSAVQGTVAGVSAMVPEGLVLLTSIAFAAGVVRLGRWNVLTRELGAIEGLARVDVLLVDKTGTLTEPGMRVVAVEHVATDRSIDGAVLDALAALAAADPDPNPTMSAIATAYPPRPGWTCAAFTAFSSDRGWTAAQFNGHGTWFLGAAETLVAPDDAGRVNDVIRAHSEVGARVVVLSYSPQEPPPPVSPALPNDLAAVAVVALAEQVKADVAETMSYFAAQGVAVKVLSGDSPATVAAIAARAGLGVSVPVDACDLPDDPTALAAFVDAHDVFGRVHPEQKQAVVVALQQAGHTVAMTGDGVNDLLALKRADVGIAMGQGSTATRSVAQFVLLDGSFAALPAVVAEGRRVIANVERVAGLFVAKTVYAFALALTTGVARLPFPLLPRQLSLIGALSIGLPGFVLAMEPNQTRARPGFARRVLRTAIPAGVVAAAATFAAYADARSDGATLPAARTTATVVLFIVASWLLALVARPWNTRRLALLVSLVALFATALLLPATRRYFEFTAPPSRTWPTAGALILVACAALSAGRRLASRHAAA